MYIHRARDMGTSCYRNKGALNVAGSCVPGISHCVETLRSLDGPHNTESGDLYNSLAPHCGCN